MKEDAGFFETINDYYNFINTAVFNSIELASLINNINKKSNNLDNNEKLLLELEINCLQFNVKNGEILPLYVRENKDGNKIFYPNIDSINDDNINYLQRRINDSLNIYLKTRFAHIIWYKTKNFEYAKKSVDFYFELIKYFKDLDIEYPANHYGIEVCYAISNLEHLVFTTKYKIEEFRDLLLELIINFNPQSSCFLKLQADCLKILIEKVKKKKFENKVLYNLEQLCEDTLKAKLNYFFATDYLKIGEEISRILKTDYNKWILKQAEYYENLSNTENPIIAPEYCQKAIDLYKKLKNESKVNELYSKYSFLCKSIKLFEYNSDKFDLKPCIEIYEKLAQDLSSDEILKFIVYSSYVIPKYSEEKLQAENLNQTGGLFAMVNTTIIDEYGHIIDRIESDADELQHTIYSKYDIWYDMYSKILLYFFKKAFELQKFNYEILLNFLKNTWYGINFEKKLSGNKTYEYNWLEYINPSLETFFLKFEKYLKGEDNYTLFIPEIDSLTLKIEGIIRDIIHYSNIEDFRIFSFDKDKFFYWKNINQYLKDEKIFQVIPENDVYFLRYLLIEHRNLRNRVAHCLTFLGEYGIYTMIILLMAILRLSKCLVVKPKSSCE